MEGWQDAFVPDAMHMLDYADENGYRQRSASFIDAVIVQDTLGGGRILLLADAWAWNGGLFQHLADASGGTEMRSVARGDGFCTIGGKKYLLLSDQNRKGNANGQTGNINENTDRSRFNYAADIYGAPDENGRYPVYHLNGTPRAYKAVGTPVSDANLSLGGLSAYSLTKEYELCRDGTLLTVAQNAENQSAGPVEVPMKIFYEDSELQMYNTSYIMQFYSDDGGAQLAYGQNYFRHGKAGKLPVLYPRPRVRAANTERRLCGAAASCRSIIRARRMQRSFTATTEAGHGSTAKAFPPSTG